MRADQQFTPEELALGFSPDDLADIIDRVDKIMLHAELQTWRMSADKTVLFYELLFHRCLLGAKENKKEEPRRRRLKGGADAR